MSILKRVRTSKKGRSVYQLEGVRGSLTVTKSMFKDSAPDTLEVVGVEFAPPGEGGSGRPTDPERLAKAQERATKAEARAQKAREKAEKLAARAAKTETPAEEPVQA